MSTPIQLAAGIDIGGTNSVFGLVDRDGKPYGERSIRTTDFRDVERFVEALGEGIEQLLAALDFAYELAGIGIGAPNANYYRGIIDHAPNLPWKGEVALRRMIEEKFPGRKVVLTNDAKAAAVGEMTYGGARGMRDFIVVTLGTGLGSGFVVDGQVVYGHGGFAGELGHTIVRSGGRMCGCGRKGCLETYASASGIKRTIFKLLADRPMGEPSVFRDKSFNTLTSKEITDAVLHGDPIAVEAYEYTGEILGQALANAVAVTEPEAIFLFGGLAKAGKWLFEPTQRHLEANLLAQYRSKVRLLPSQLGEENAAVLGASSLVW